VPTDAAEESAAAAAATAPLLQAGLRVVVLREGDDWREGTVQEKASWKKRHDGETWWWVTFKGIARQEVRFDSWTDKQGNRGGRQQGAADRGLRGLT
jgi:hypothetical protein